MAQVIDTSGDEAVARSDIEQPEDSVGPAQNREVVVIRNFADVPEEVDRIEFRLDERFRERAIQDLLDNSVNLEENLEPAERDLANFISVDLNADSPAYITTIMRHRLYRRDAVRNIIDTEFSELV